MTAPAKFTHITESFDGRLSYDFFDTAENALKSHWNEIFSERVTRSEITFQDFGSANCSRRTIRKWSAA